MSSSSRPSRSLRKRQPAKLADDIDFDLETLLKEHEQKGAEHRAKRDAKKQKTGKDEEVDKYAGAFTGYEIPFDTLPALCIERIFAMLDSPQDLFNLAFSSKFLMSLVTPETVIRSAVFNNLRKRDKGNRKTMSNIMGYISNRSIHVPSTHRMLRLLNARSCERGDRCWGKNLNTGKAMALNRNSTNRPFGLALCDKCVKFGTTKVPYSHFSRFQQGVAFHQWNLLMNPQRDPKTGDVSGPLLEVLELQQIENTYANNDDKKSALEGIVQKALSNDGKYCPIHYEEKAAAYQEIYENAEKEADDTVAAALEMDQQKYIQRRDERIAKRMTRIRSIYASVEEILDDCPLKDLALDCTWLESDERCVKFSCHVVEQKLGTIISAPASASERSINNAANDIKRIFNTLNEKSFFTFSFIENSSNRFRRGIYEYCRNETTPLEIMQSSMAGDVHFMQALEEDKPIRALVRALNRMRGALPKIFALSVMRPIPRDRDAENRVDEYRRLAEVVWNKKSPSQYGSEIFSFNSMKDTFNSSVEEFQTIKSNAKDYLLEDQTRRFLLRDDSVAGRDNFSRQDALNTVFSPKIHTVWMTGTRSSAYELIMERNFESLRNLHEQYFRRPSQYGVSRA
mmetsp:Transcript_22739/g.49227  ORF Transcript_22739/g.49227 Transcript_22739/m.49227 type:complete len:626 (-) Transcript_22739:318-2195(-)|eukprot:CAMPEP_0172310218 /NCGR_PEP_ID=MMETSP1058-20130122/11355_1 /TAXON_ID=83371 /ORGANISM="Detonula confervacea, Strain CCMP 353" /LENGTH=625 /DNA_ID=CAMNT_0013022989 /DNA_START=160 /DNA_END=2037 /DNA_ORIENTATION=+